MIIVCLLLCLLLLLSFLVYASYSIQSGIYLRSFCKKHTAEKIVALTFDDGPDSLQTPKVLQVLKEYQVTACFFCIGHKVKGNEAILQKMVAEGHLIGNHSYRHIPLTKAAEDPFRFIPAIRALQDEKRLANLSV